MFIPIKNFFVMIGILNMIGISILMNLVRNCNSLQDLVIVILTIVIKLDRILNRLRYWFNKSLVQLIESMILFLNNQVYYLYSQK